MHFSAFCFILNNNINNYNSPAQFLPINTQFLCSSHPQMRENTSQPRWLQRITGRTCHRASHEFTPTNFPWKIKQIIERKSRWTRPRVAPKTSSGNWNVSIVTNINFDIFQRQRWHGEKTAEGHEKKGPDMQHCPVLFLAPAWPGVLVLATHMFQSRRTKTVHEMITRTGKK